MNKIKKGRQSFLQPKRLLITLPKGREKRAAQEVDVVTTGTFGPMCSSGAYFNVGHTKPRIKLGGGKTSSTKSRSTPVLRQSISFWGQRRCRRMIREIRSFLGNLLTGEPISLRKLVAGKDVRLTRHAYGTDCYPRKTLETYICLKDMNEAVLFNMRNAYQNYNVAVNLSDRVIYTYMGVLQPKMGNANYCSAGRIESLLNDPLYKTIGSGDPDFPGRRDWIRGRKWNPTQSWGEADRKQGSRKCRQEPSAVTGDLKLMTPNGSEAPHSRVMG